MRRRQRRRSGGFSLLQRMLAVAIVGILATIGFERCSDNGMRQAQGAGAAVEAASAAAAEPRTAPVQRLR